MLFRAYGKLPRGKRLERIRRSPNYRDGAFQNLSPTNTFAGDASVWKTMKDFFNKPSTVIPPAKLPSLKTDLKTLQSNKPAIVWFGHSSYLINTGTLNILVDPVFGGNAAPLKFMIRAFDGSNVYTVDDLPPIDILILTHDHYDHLDHQTILELNGKVRMIVCALGVGSHLEYWGVPPGIISELDWCERFTYEDITLIAAPARHFSGRGLKRGQSLWCSFILQAGETKIYLGGDSGYDTHFKKIGDEYGPFSIILLESGQYNPSWPNIHMMPEEAVQAAIDLNAEVLMPLHWGKFALSMHPWNEPVKRIVKKAAELNQKLTVPLIGQPVEVGGALQTEEWWENI
jgi:L-ascorbate metabolism protein UlaG (beta-lactamase superfamily)